MEMMEEKTWNDQDRWRLLSKTQPWTIEDTRLDEYEEEDCIVTFMFLSSSDKSLFIFQE